MSVRARSQHWRARPWPWEQPTGCCASAMTEWPRKPRVNARDFGDIGGAWSRHRWLNRLQTALRRRPRVGAPVVCGADNQQEIYMAYIDPYSRSTPDHFI